MQRFNQELGHLNKIYVQLENEKYFFFLLQFDIYKSILWKCLQTKKRKKKKKNESREASTYDFPVYLVQLQMQPIAYNLMVKPLL